MRAATVPHKFKKAWRLLVTEERSTQVELDALKRDLKAVEREARGDPSAASLRLEEIERRTTALTAQSQASNEILQRWNRRVGQVTVASQLLTLAVGLVAISGSSAIHLEYYSAVAAISPVLLIAGLVEIGQLGLSGGIWAVLSFALPVSSAGGAALIALAIHRSTASLAYLTWWGLAVTLLVLVGYAWMHVSKSRR